MKSTDADPFGRHDVRPGTYTVSSTRSRYLTMRDGARIATDVTLPDGLAAGARVPTILRQTRYFRAFDYRPWFHRLGLVDKLDFIRPMREYFVRRGYAWVEVCVRGSGASGGRRPFPWSPAEIRDGAEIVDWIVTQSWSNGIVGAQGISYEGTTAEMLLVNKHPAVRAVIPRFSLFDVYTDVAFPGGVHQTWFTEAWGRFNAALDANTHPHAFAGLMRHNLEGFVQEALDKGQREQARLLRLVANDRGEALIRGAMSLATRGVRPVDDDAGRRELLRLIGDHEDNYDVHEGAQRVDFRDDTGISEDAPDETIDAFSPHAHGDAIRDSGAAIYSHSGWMDSMYPHAAIKRFGAIDNAGSRLILGPWDHGGGQNISPHNSGKWAAFDHNAEMLRFFDAHIGNGPKLDEPPVRYFTMGEERWKEAQTWPPPEATPQTWFIGPDQTLGREAPTHEGGFDRHRPRGQATSGRRSRWRTLLGLLATAGRAGHHDDEIDALVYRSAPLAEPLVVTGHPIAHLWVAVPTEDLYIHVYLNDERPDGRWYGVTEGLFRALHRKVSRRKPPYPQHEPYHTYLRADARPMAPDTPAKLSFGLIPTSYRFSAGHRLRLTIAFSDADHFPLHPKLPGHVDILRRKGKASALELPIMPSS